MGTIRPLLQLPRRRSRCRLPSLTRLQSPPYDPATFVQEEYPEYWREEIRDGEKVLCTVDAKVEYMPGPYKIYTVEKAPFTKGDAVRILRAFADDSDFPEFAFPGEGFFEFNGTGISYFFNGRLIQLTFAEEDTEPVVQEEFAINKEAGRFTNINITESAAKQTAEEFLEKIGAEGFVFAKSEKARMVHRGVVDSEGWEMYFVRDYKGYMPYSLYLYNQNSKLSLQTPACAPYLTDTIILYITEDGCMDMVWWDPVITAYESYEEEPLLSFAEITERLRTLLERGADPAPRSKKDMIKVTELRLTYAGFKDPRDPNKMILRPVWIAAYTTEKREEAPWPHSVLCIDAVTGEMVNPFAAAR